MTVPKMVKQMQYVNKRYSFINPPAHQHYLPARSVETGAYSKSEFISNAY